MPKARSPIIADTMCICSLTEVCLPEEALCLPPNVLKAVRQAIYDNVEEYISIVEDPEFKNIFL